MEACTHVDCRYWLGRADENILQKLVDIDNKECPVIIFKRFTSFILVQCMISVCESIICVCVCMYSKCM